MKVAVFSGVNADYMKLSARTFPSMLLWSLKHDYKFFEYYDVPGGLNAYWTGVACGLELLRQGYDRIIYLDADQFITNFDIDFKDIPLHGFHVSKDWGDDATEPWHFSMCGFIAHQDCIDFFETILRLREFPEFAEGTPFQEQAAVQYLVRTGMESAPETTARLVTIHPRKLFNNVPDEVCPGSVPEPWKPGDFAAHLTMVDMDRRLELAKEFLARMKDMIKISTDEHTKATHRSGPGLPPRLDEP